jgi:hypothetical protein
MKVGELKRTLDNANDDTEVMIVVKLPFSTVGGTPVVPVKFAHEGFDWDKGKFILTPEESLMPSDRDFAAKMKDLQDKFGWVQYENRGLKAEIKKLKTQLGITE